MITMIGTTLRLVFTRRGYVIGAVLTTLLTAALYAYAGQIVTVFADGTLFVDLGPTRLAALAAVSLLMGLVLPVQVFALRRAAWGIRQGGTGLLGFVAALSSPCCSPLILPAILAFAGFSGSAVLSLNVTLYRYFVPLAALSVVFLGVSFVLAARDVTRACTLMPAQRGSQRGPGGLSGASDHAALSAAVARAGYQTGALEGVGVPAARGDQVRAYRMPVTGMTCTRCEVHVAAALREAGALTAEADVRRGEARFTAPATADPARFGVAVAQANYTPGSLEPLPNSHAPG